MGEQAAAGAFSKDTDQKDLSFGGVAQLGEHLPCKQGVMSSNLTISTMTMSHAKHESIGNDVFTREFTRISCLIGRQSVMK